MRCFAASLCGLALISIASAQETIENPSYAAWAKKKIGTQVIQKTTSEVMGQKFEATITYKLLEIKDDKVVVEMITKSKVSGTEVEQPATKIDVTKSTTVPKGMKKEDVQQGRPEGTIAEGEETLKVAGKEYKTKWFKYKRSSEGTEIDSQSWICMDVPNLLVKMTSKVTGKDPNLNSKTTMELVEIKEP